MESTGGSDRGNRDDVASNKEFDEKLWKYIPSIFE